MPDTQSGLSLWPSEFGEVTAPTPVAILRQQATLLGAQTQNIVVGRVTTRADGVGGAFIHHFSLYCSPLAYQVELFYVGHGVELYPVHIHFPDESNGGSLHAQDVEEFKARLKEVFAREKTRKIIASLLAQSRE